MAIILFDGEFPLLGQVPKRRAEVLPEKVSHLFRSARSLQFVCDVRALSGTSPTLDVAIQAKIEAYWYNLVRFSQYADATGSKVITVKRDFVVAASVEPTGNPAISTGELLQAQLWSDTLRVSCKVDGTDPVFFFSVTAEPATW